MSCWKGVGCSPIGGQETESGVGGVPAPMDFCLPPFRLHPGPQPTGRCFPHSGQVLPLQLLSHTSVIPENALTDTPSDFVSNLLGVSQSSQVDSSHQTLGVSGDKNRMCSLSLRLVTNHQYRLQGIPMAAGVIRGINIY